MKIKLIVLIVVLFCGAFFLIQSKKADEQAAHAAFMGSPPEASKPYNVLDYTKPAK